MYIKKSIRLKLSSKTAFQKQLPKKVLKCSKIALKMGNSLVKSILTLKSRKPFPSRSSVLNRSFTLHHFHWQT